MGEITLEYLKNYIFEKTGLEEVLFERPKITCSGYLMRKKPIY